ncbi:MAG: VOC family protein [Gemmatimonadales bacterium]
MESTLPKDTCVTRLALNVLDLEQQIAFYTTVIGLSLQHSTDDSAELGAAEHAILLLRKDERASRQPTVAGLYHVALLLPTREQLANALGRLSDHAYRLDGAADHGVSEALYLTDPDGNGIELYCDRSRAEWPVKNGRLHMVTEPLDLPALAELSDATTTLVHEATRLGHVHLSAAGIAECESFYVDQLGFDLMQRFGDQATFMSAGGYHHHIAANVWGYPRSRRTKPVIGLAWFEIGVSERQTFDAIGDRVEQSAIELDSNSLQLADPSGIEVRIRLATA